MDAVFLLYAQHEPYLQGVFKDEDAFGTPSSGFDQTTDRNRP